MMVAETQKDVLGLGKFFNGASQALKKEVQNVLGTNKKPVEKPVKKPIDIQIEEPVKNEFTLDDDIMLFANLVHTHKMSNKK